MPDFVNARALEARNPCVSLGPMNDIKPVTSDDMLMEQVEQALRMTPEQRVKTGSELFVSWCHMARGGVRGNFPGATEDEIEARLRQRLVWARELDGRVPA